MDGNKINSKLKENYDNYYNSSEKEWRRLGAIAKTANIVALCKDIPHNSILEIGAGEGAILAQLSEIGFGSELYAVDISTSGVNAIKSRGLHNLIESHVFDGSKVPYSKARFDLVILSHVVEHLEHPRQLLYEAARVGKHVYVEVPLEHTARSPLDFVFDRVGHINFYTPKTIRWLLQSCGLEVLNQITTPASLAIHEFQKGLKGKFIYHLKRAVLAINKKLGTSLFCYNCSLVTKAEKKQTEHL